MREIGNAGVNVEQMKYADQAASDSAQARVGTRQFEWDLLTWSAMAPEDGALMTR